MSNSESNAKSPAARTLQGRFFDLITNLTGQSNILTIPRFFIDFTGSITAALFLSQLFFRQGQKGKDIFFYKTYEEWEEEISLKKMEVYKLRKTFEKRQWLKTKVMKVHGDPTLHWCLNADQIEVDIGIYIQNRTNVRLKMRRTNVSDRDERSSLPETNYIYNRDDGKESTNRVCEAGDHTHSSFSPVASSFLKDGQPPSKETANGTALDSKGDIPGNGARKEKLETCRRAPRPSEKMICYAESLARKQGLNLKDEVIENYAACSAFIDETKAAAAAAGPDEMVSDGEGRSYPLSFLKEKYRCGNGNTAKVAAIKETMIRIRNGEELPPLDEAEAEDEEDGDDVIDGEFELMGSPSSSSSSEEEEEEEEEEGQP